MTQLLSQALPVSVLLTAVVFFTGLFFKIATQTLKFKPRTLKYLQNMFITCLIVLIFSMPLVTAVSVGIGKTAPLWFRVLPTIIAAASVLGMWKSFESIVRLCPPDEIPEEEEEEFSAAEELPASDELP